MMSYAGMRKAPGQFGIGGSRIAPRVQPQPVTSGLGRDSAQVHGIGGSYMAARNTGATTEARADNQFPSAGYAATQNPSQGVVAGYQQPAYQPQQGPTPQELQEEMMRRQSAAQMANQNPDNSALAGYMFG